MVIKITTRQNVIIWYHYLGNIPIVTMYQVPTMELPARI